MDSKTLRHVEGEVNEWNALYEIGQAVTVEQDDGSKIITSTRSNAWIGRFTAVISLNGISGCYMLSRVTPTDIVINVIGGNSIIKCSECGYEHSSYKCPNCGKIGDKKWRKLITK